MPARRSLRRSAAAASLAALASCLLVALAPAAGAAGGPVAVGGAAVGYAEPTVTTVPGSSSSLVGGAIAYVPAGEPTVDRGDAPRIAAFRSTDAGRTWIERLLALPPGFAAAYDPSVAFAGPSVSLFSAVASTRTGCVTQGSVVLYRSTNGGASWGPPVPVEDNLGTGLFGDKPRLAADPVTGRVWLAWSRAATASADPCAAMPARNQLLVATSDDAGRTFSAPARIRVPGYRTLFGAWPAAGPDGTLYVAFEALDPVGGASPAAIYVARSTNAGASFSAPVEVGPAVQPAAPAGADTYAVAWPTLAVDPAGGRVWVAWADAATGTPRILVASSPLGRLRFGRPRPLPGAAALGPQLNPAFGPGPRPVLGFLAFAGGLRAWVTTPDRSGMRPPVPAAPPAAEGSPFQLGEYVGAAVVGGRAAVMWPAVGGGRQRVWFARTPLAVRPLSSPGGATGGSTGAGGAGPAGIADRTTGGGASGAAGALRTVAVGLAVGGAVLALAGMAGRARRRPARRRPR